MEASEDTLTEGFRQMPHHKELMIIEAQNGAIEGEDGALTKHLCAMFSTQDEDKMPLLSQTIATLTLTALHTLAQHQQKKIISVIFFCFYEAVVTAVKISGFL
eukprot:11533519-Ditylum_brightwellii.AAC.1